MFENEQIDPSFYEAGEFVPDVRGHRASMQRPIENIVADFDKLMPNDFAAGGNGLERLYALCDEARASNDVNRCAPVLFRTMERLDEVDEVDLGAPGPLVHTLETYRGVYEPLLVESVRRKPTSLSVWMVNRILNANSLDPDAWLALLQEAAKHASASTTTKLSARGFVDYQLKRRSTNRPSS